MTITNDKSEIIDSAGDHAQHHQDLADAVNELLEDDAADDASSTLTDGSQVVRLFDSEVTANPGVGTFTTHDRQTVADNAAFAAGAAKVFMAGYVYDETADAPLTENNAAAARINVNRSLVNVFEDGVTRGRYATVTSANAVKVDGSAVTQPVSIAGTVTVTGGLTDTQLRATPVPVSGTVTANAGSGTFAVSAASLPLPTGASTAAKQPALGTAGTASADVLTIQGIASMTAVKVDGSAVTQPVSGTVAFSNTTIAVTNAGTFATQAAQSGTWTVQPGNTANTTAWKVDGSAVTQPVSAAALPLPSGAATSALQTTGNTSLSSIDGKITAVNTGAVVVASSALPSGASTAAKQPALGTAGTASADVISIQGIASMTAVKVDGSAVTQPVSGTVSITANSAVNVAQVNGVTTQTGTGTAGTGTQRVAVASDSSINAVQSGTWTVQPGNTANTTAWKVDGSAVTQPVSGTVAVSNAFALDATLTGGTQTARVTDGTNTATVKAASTAAAATDKALVVAVSPNNTITTAAGANSVTSVTLQSGATATGVGSNITVTGYPTVEFFVTGASNIGLTPQASYDGGTTWVSVAYHTLNAASTTMATVGALSGTLNGGYVASVLGATHFRANITAYTSGTVTITAQGSASPYTAVLQATLPTFTSGTTATSASTNNGIAGVGVQRVVVASDNTAFLVKPSVDGTNMADVTHPLFVELSDGAAALGTVSNTLKIDGSGVTQPVSGTVSLTAQTADVTTTKPTTGVQLAGWDEHAQVARYADVAKSNSLNVLLTKDDEVQAQLERIELRLAEPSEMPQPVSGTVQLQLAAVGGGTVIAVSAATSAVLLAPTNLSRSVFSVWNNSTAAMYIKCGDGATTALASVKVVAGGYWEMPSTIKGLYLGNVTAVWDTATGTACVTEIS